MPSVSTPPYPMRIEFPDAVLPVVAERTPEQVMREIQRWPYWQEIQAIAAKEYKMQPETFEALLPEYQRFLGLILLGYSPLGMFSRQVDEIWHSQVLASHLWLNFCLTLHGRMINHVPQILEKAQCICNPGGPSCRNCSGGGQGCEGYSDQKQGQGTAAEFVAAYLQAFGQKPPVAIWNLSEAEGCASL